MKVLLVSYDYPPIGGSGVQRNVKFLKYLNQMGFETSVLTVNERAFYVFDHSLLKEVADTKVYRAKSYDPVSVFARIKRKLKWNNIDTTTSDSIVSESSWYVPIYRVIRNWFFLPDGYSGWIGSAVKLGSKVIEEKGKPDIIIGSFPGPTNAFVAYRLAERFSIPFVLDFRDAWVDDPYVTFTSFFHKLYHKYYERKIVSRASGIIVYGESLKEILLKKYPQIEGRINVITNGFDPEDLLEIKPVIRNTEKIRVVYSGSIYLDRRLTYESFISALCLLSDKEKEKLEVIFVGDKLGWAVDLVKKNNLSSVVSFTGYTPHLESLNYLASADAALLFLAKGDFVALTGKIFEYLGLGLPIIACVETSGACAELLKTIDHDQGVCSPTDSEEIVGAFRLALEKKMPKLAPTNMDRFSRKKHTEILANNLRKAVASYN